MNKRPPTTTAAATVQTIVGGPHTPRGWRRQVGNVGEKHYHPWSVCHVGSIFAVVLSTGCPSLSKDVRNNKMLSYSRDRAGNLKLGDNILQTL